MFASRLSCALLLAAVCFPALAQVNSIYSPSDLTAAAASAQALLSKSTPNAQDAYLATVILGVAGTTASSKAACASLIATAGSSSASMLEASFALRAAHAIGCDNVVTAAVVSKVQAGLDTGRVSELYGAASSLRVLSAAKQGLSVSWAAIIDTVAELAEEDGKFRESKDKGATSSSLNTGFAYSIFAAGWADVQGSPSSARVVTAVASFAELLSDALGSDTTTLALGASEGSSDHALSTAFVFAGRAELAAVAGDVIDIPCSPAEVEAFTRYFLSLRGADVRVAGPALLGLSSLMTGPSPPFAVRALNDVLTDGASTPLQVSITNVLGGSVSPLFVTLKGVIRAADSSTLVPGKKLTASKDSSVFEIDMMSKKPSPGSYAVRLSIEPAAGSDYEAVDAATVNVKVLGSVVLSTATILVDGGKDAGATAASVTATFPNPANKALSVAPGTFLHVSFSVASGSGSPLSPHQVFVMLKSSAITKPAVFVATAEAPGSYRLSIDGSSRDALKTAVVAGTYSVDVVIGDAVIQQPIVWNIGSINITPPPAPAEQPEVLYTKPLLHESDTTLVALPVIEHQFRVADVRAPAAVSSFFSVLVCLPLVLLIAGIFKFGGANLSRVSEVSTIAFIGFELSLAALLGLLVLYWLQLNMFEVLVLFIVPTTTCVMFGQRVLKALHATTTAAAAKAKKD